MSHVFVCKLACFMFQYTSGFTSTVLHRCFFSFNHFGRITPENLLTFCGSSLYTSANSNLIFSFLMLMRVLHLVVWYVVLGVFFTALVKLSGFHVDLLINSAGFLHW